MNDLVYSRILIHLSIVLTIVTGLTVIKVGAQTRPQNPLQRSNSDTRFNRDRNGGLQRQSSYSESCKTNYKYDYIQLTLIWAPGSCSTSPQECVREENKHLTVHGMWPTIKGTQEPSNCCFDNNFNYKALQPILPTLNEYWYSYYDSRGSFGFWSHEWLKHGTCSRDIAFLKGELRYFNTTVQLARQLPIMEYLKQANILPDNQKSYKSADIVRALAPLVNNKTFQINCDFEHDQPIPVVTGFGLCYDGDLKPADCPEMRRKCQRQLIFRSTSKRNPRFVRRTQLLGPNVEEKFDEK